MGAVAVPRAGAGAARLRQVTALLVRSSRKTHWEHLPEAVLGVMGVLCGGRDQPLRIATRQSPQPRGWQRAGLSGSGRSGGTRLAQPQPLLSSFTSLLPCHYRIRGRMPLLTNYYLKLAFPF